jgi:hypothetical protein
MWTGIRLTASVAAVLPWLLLMVEVLPFDVHVGLAAVSISLFLCWAGVVSGSAGHGDVGRPGGRRRLPGRQGEGLWAWVVGGLPGAMAWIAFAVWTLLVATDSRRSPR